MKRVLARILGRLAQRRVAGIIVGFEQQIDSESVSFAEEQ